MSHCSEHWYSLALKLTMIVTLKKWKIRFTCFTWLWSVSVWTSHWVLSCIKMPVNARHKGNNKNNKFLLALNKWIWNNRLFFYWCKYWMVWYQNSCLAYLWYVKPGTNLDRLRQFRTQQCLTFGAMLEWLTGLEVLKCDFLSTNWTHITQYGWL